MLPSVCRILRLKKKIKSKLPQSLRCSEQGEEQQAQEFQGFHRSSTPRVFVCPCLGHSRVGTRSGSCTFHPKPMNKGRTVIPDLSPGLLLGDGQVDFPGTLLWNGPVWNQQTDPWKRAGAGVTLGKGRAVRDREHHQNVPLHSCFSWQPHQVKGT